MENLQVTSPNASSVSTEKFQTTTEYPFPVEKVFAWHTRPGAFTRLNPPWNPVKLIESSDSIQNGARVKIKAGIPPVRFTWELAHSDYQENAQFIDSQIRGPFSIWKHTHAFSAVSESASKINDTINFKLPLLNKVFAPLLKHELSRVFRYRKEVLQKDLACHDRWISQPRKKILIAGSSGLLGTALTAFLTTAGHTVYRLVRRPPRTENEFQWDPVNEQLAPVPPVDAVINLCGEDISAGRWSAEKKLRLISSRVTPTLFLASKINTGEISTRSFVSASGIGYYGSRGAEALSESSSAGTGFFPDLAQQWEAAAQSVKGAHTRAVCLRFGVIITARGGALKKMLPPFLCGLGGPLGSGEQFTSWISLQDALGAIEQILHDDRAFGAINLVAPGSITNREFTKSLGTVLRRPTVFSVPAPALRLMVGELADEALLSSARVQPEKLTDLGFLFQLPMIEQALRFELGR